MEEIGNLEHTFLWVLIILITVILVKTATSGTYYTGIEIRSGKIIVVTGANSGIGYQTSLDLAHHGATIILACRNKTRGENARNSIRTLSGNQNVYFIPLNLSSLESVRQFVRSVKSQFVCVDVLVNNAGIIFVPESFTMEGFELNFGVNHLGHFLLTLLMLPLLNIDTSRIINVSSVMYIFAKADNLTNMGKKRPYNAIQAYSDSKLGNVLSTTALHKRLHNKNFRCCSLDPGIIYSDIGRDSWFMSSVIYKVFCRPITWLLFKDTVAGAQTTLHCVCHPHITGGAFYSECERRLLWPVVKRGLETKLWEDSVRLIALTTQEHNEISKHVSL